MEQAIKKTDSRYGWSDWLVIGMVFVIIGVMLGYAWRMHHEAISQTSQLSPNMIYTGDLSMEIGKKKEFFLIVDDNTMLHFLPLRKAKYEMAIRREVRP